MEQFLLYLVLSLARSSVVEMAFPLTGPRFPPLRSKPHEMLGRKDADELLAHGTIVAFSERSSFLRTSAFAVALFDNLCRAVPRPLKTCRDRSVELRGTGKTPKSGWVSKTKPGPGKEQR
ncbi:MAG: hypothetical protein ABIK86_07685 [candidate division WOR-3 bacterium]